MVPKAAADAPPLPTGVRVLPGAREHPRARGGLSLRRRAPDARHRLGADACAPELLLVDELSQGLAPLMVQELLGRLQAIRRDLGMTILLVEQNAAVALDVADHGYIIENGRIVLDGTPERLRSHQDVQEFYLGGAARAATIAKSSNTAAAGAGMADQTPILADAAPGEPDARLRRIEGALRRFARGCPGRAAGADRPERRRQDQRAQLHLRHLQARGRTRVVRGRRHHRAKAPLDRAARHCADLPARRSCSRT